MKKLLLIGTMLLLGCPTVPAPQPHPQPSPSATAQPSAKPSTTAPVPAPEPQRVIQWVPFNSELKVAMESQDRCLLLYFGGSCGNACDFVEKEFFQNQELVKVINQAFVSSRFPADEYQEFLPELGIETLPAFAVTSTSKSDQSVLITGLTSPERMTEVFNSLPFYQECLDRETEFQ